MGRWWSSAALSCGHGQQGAASHATCCQKPGHLLERALCPRAPPNAHMQTMGNGYQWVYWITPTSYPIYGLVASQLGNVDTPTVLPDGVSRRRPARWNAARRVSAQHVSVQHLYPISIVVRLCCFLPTPCIWPAPLQLGKATCQALPQANQPSFPASLFPCALGQHRAGQRVHRGLFRLQALVCGLGRPHLHRLCRLLPGCRPVCAHQDQPPEPLMHQHPCCGPEHPYYRPPRASANQSR